MPAALGAFLALSKERLSTANALQQAGPRRVEDRKALDYSFFSFLPNPAQASHPGSLIGPTQPPGRTGITDCP